MAESEETSLIVSTLNAGSELTGVTAGALAGTLMAGPAGAVGGAAIGWVVQKSVGSALTTWVGGKFSRRGQVRVGATVAIAAVTIERQLAAGAHPRADWFSAEPARSKSKPRSGRTIAEEIAEGVLLAAEKEHEERKIQLMGRLIGNLVFHPEISRDLANQLIRITERLSYRQLCMMALFNLGVRENYNLAAGAVDVGMGNSPSVGALLELKELHDLMIVQQTSDEGPHTDIILTTSAIHPATTQMVMGIGGWLTTLMDMPGSIPPDDIEAVAALLR